MTQEEKDAMKLESYKEYAKWILSNNPEDKSVYLFKNQQDSNKWGFLIVGQEGEDLDNHCSDCQQEKIILYKFSGTPDFPYNTIFGIIGPTKFKRIQDGSEKELLGNYILCEQIGGQSE